MKPRVNSFIVKATNAYNKQVYWTGFVWSLKKEDAKPYKTQKIAESCANRIKYKFHDGSEFKSGLEAEEIINKNKIGEA